MTRIFLAALFAAFSALTIRSVPALTQADSAPIATTATVTGTVSTTGPVTETVKNLGNNIYGVDATIGDLPALMAPEDVDKLAALEAAPGGTAYKFLSPVSRDDQSVLVRMGGTSFGFLNLRDGTITPLQVERLSGTTNFVWLDDDTLGFLTTDPINMKGTIVGAAIDRRTGEIAYGEPRLAAIAALNQGKRIVSLISPDLSKVLLVDSSEAKQSPLFQPPDSSWDTLPPNDKFMFSEGTKLQVVDLTTGEFADIGDRPGVYHNVTPTNDSREIVYVFSSYTDPPEFFRANFDGTGTTQLTSLNAEVKALSQTEQHPVSFTLRDGSTFDGVLVLPAGVPFPPQEIPIVVWQAGGPTAIMANSWQNSVESPQGLLPNFGIGVLSVPIYGRYGVGPERFSALVDDNNFGQADIDVQTEIAEQLRSRGWASKVGIAGCSYGGYFVLQSIIRHPRTYDAAHAMCAIADLILEWNTGDGILAPWVYGQTPWEELDEYRSDSPIYQADEARTPLLAFKGTQDFLPADMIRNFVLQVVDNGVPAKMLLFQAAKHNFASTPEKLAVPYALYGAQEQILWFRKYLGQ